MKKIARFLLHLIKSKIEAVVFPRVGGQYHYLTFGNIFIAPSKRQIKIIRNHKISNWKSREYEIVEEIINLSKQSKPIILDIGANVGYTAIAYSKLLKKYNGLCVSFEPALKNILCFSKNTSHLKNVSLVSLGLGDKKEPMSLGIPAYVDDVGKDKNNTGFLSAKLPVDERSESFRSASITLDSILDCLCFNDEHIVFVKIDVEGYEAQVIRGSLQALETYLPSIQMEYNPRTNTNKEILEIFSILFSLGYVCYLEGKFSLEEQAELYFIHNKSVSITNFFDVSHFSKKTE